MTLSLAVIIPVINEENQLGGLIDNVQAAGISLSDIYIVDGGSTDGSIELARELGVNLVRSEKGRAKQMNKGAKVCKSEMLLFLHADTRLPTVKNIHDLIDAQAVVWGRFDVEVIGNSAWFKVISFFINLRSRLTRIATGDQAIFVRRDVFWLVGGFPDQPLMEDVEISKRLRKKYSPLCLREKVQTSGRRWESFGVFKTVVLMWRLRFLYWLGTSPEILARLYR